ncbi:BrnT family toxin [Phenylobacterium sp.]|uniref:BrnT family toxin n=1 Tax=Phenylobacterium sp. TaxID=1871053 RepID=UPI003564CE0E
MPFSYATAVLSDPTHRDFDVSRTVDDERRREAVGRIEGRLFTVVYTVRDGAVRMISARRSNVQEMRRYGDR